jgi:hypothetical protein
MCPLPYRSGTLFSPSAFPLFFQQSSTRPERPEVLRVAQLPKLPVIRPESPRIILVCFCTTGGGVHRFVPARLRPSSSHEHSFQERLRLLQSLLSSEKRPNGYFQGHLSFSASDSTPGYVWARHYTGPNLPCGFDSFRTIGRLSSESVPSTRHQNP